MKRFKNVFCMLLSVVMLLSFAACGKKGAADENAAQASEATPEVSTEPLPETAEKPEITVPEIDPDLGLEADATVMIKEVKEVLDRPRNIEPDSSVTFHSYDVPAYTPWNCAYEQWMTYNIYEGLTWCYMGRPDDVRPLIAESWTVSEDYLTWVFNIREGVLFTDGTVCDAPAIARSWEYHLEAAPAIFTNLNIESWEATGEYELTVKLLTPCGYLETGLSELYIVSPSALTQWGINDNRAAVGTAPYYVSGYTPGAEFVFSANPDYYLYERLPIIETVIYKIVMDDKTLLDFLLKGEIDGYTTNYVDSYNSLLSHGFDGTVMQGHSNCDPIFFNAEATPTFKIFEVRKAMNRFIDLDALNVTLYGGMGLVQTSIWAVGTSGEVPWPEGYYYDPDEGLELLAQAGVAPEDIKFSNTVLPTTETRFENIKSQLAAVGINFEYEFLDPASSFNSPVYGSSLLFSSYGYTDAKPYAPWTLILMPDALLKAVYTDLYDPELYDAMCSTYEAMMTAFTWEEMLENSKTLTDMVQRDYCAMPGVQKPYFAAFNKDLKGIVLVTDDHVLLWNYLYL